MWLLQTGMQREKIEAHRNGDVVYANVEGVIVMITWSSSHKVGEALAFCVHSAMVRG